MENYKILKGSGVIDFYINKERFEKLKTKRGKFNFVQKELNKRLSKYIGNIIRNQIEIRDLSITSNNFWSMEDLPVVNDIGYSVNNILELNEQYITIRIFQIDILALVPYTFNISNSFIELKDNKSLIKISSAKLV